MYTRLRMHTLLYPGISKKQKSGPNALNKPRVFLRQLDFMGRLFVFNDVR